MAQPADRRQQILDAALRVFAQHGPHRASIKRIAAAAGLKSPALIYWYFKDKDDLFHSVMRDLYPVVDLAQDAAALGALPPRRALARVARAYLAAFDNPDAVKLFRIYLAEAARSPKASERFLGPEMIKVKRTLVGYLRGQVARGALRDHDPEASTRALMGACLAYVLCRELVLPLREGLPEPEAYVETVVGALLDGLAAGKGRDAAALG